MFAHSHGFAISGHVEGLQGATASLSYHNTNGDDTTITAHIADGAFTLSGAILEPELVRLTIAEGWSFNTSFFLENSPISIHLFRDAPEKIIITGSKSEMVYEKLKPGLSDFFEHARENEAIHNQTHDSRAEQSADSLWTIQQHDWIQAIHSTIASDHDNYAALYFIQWLLFRPDHMDAIRSVFMELSPVVRDCAVGRRFLHDYEHLLRASAGQMAPEISGSDTSGRAITLASYRGEVILLDFWSSYCGPCRLENRRLLPIYQSHHASGFEIVSYSMDDNRSLWLKAILADGLIWPQASELRGGAGATPGIYDITDLPRNVLIDRTGRIYARDIHGADLTQAIELLLGKDK